MATSKSVLWVDDEAELLEPHGIFLREKGYDVEWARNADDAVEMLRRRPFSLVLLDEQMPGRRGMEVYREMRDIDPTIPVVMVTKSEEDATLAEAIGANIRDYLVKPVSPRQVLTVVTRIIDGPRIRQEATARRFVERFRELQFGSGEPRGWREWIDYYTELTYWEVELAAAGESGLYDALRSLYPDVHRDFAQFMYRTYPRWLRDLGGDRPPLSIDIVPEFLMPAAGRGRTVVFVVIDCLRLDQWRVLEPLLAQYFEVETAHYYAVLPTATPYSRNALFSGLFPSEIATRYPDWWGDRADVDESLNAHEKELLQAQLTDLGKPMPVHYEKISTATESDSLERRIPSVMLQEGILAYVFNFVDLLTHGRSESGILYEVARDEPALRNLTREWFRRSAAFSLLKEAARKGISVLLTSDHGSIHCNTPATVFAKRDASANLRYKFGEDLRPERADQALLFREEEALRIPRYGSGGNTLLAAGDTFFVYPTKLREYQSRYRGSFLHGGVTPEEVILPVSLLTPRTT